MIKVVVYTNILFSAILNLNSNIAQLLINGKSQYEFFSPKYAKEELFRHKSKILVITGFTDEEFQEIYEITSKNITFLNHSILPRIDFDKALQICSNIDKDDTIFVAFSIYLNSLLWTGDKKLLAGLNNKDFRQGISTKELYKDYIRRL